MKRFMKEDIFDDPKSWTTTTWENDQEKLKALENRVKTYLLDLERQYKVHFLAQTPTNIPNIVPANRKPVFISFKNRKFLVLAFTS